MNNTDNFYQPGSLERHLLDECKAMAKHALASGMAVPPRLVQELNSLDRACRRCDDSTGEAPDHPAAANDAAPDLARHLTQIHGQLARLVAPARPGALLLFTKEAADGGLKQYLGPVPLIRRMMSVAILSLLALVVVSLNPHVNGSPESFSLLKNSGPSLLFNEIFLLTSASIGASFYALFQANQYIQKGTYDPRYEASYWIRFVLGLLAGMIIATLIPIEPEGNGSSVAASLHGLEKPILAMLGGFSAPVVYRILNRLIAAVESVVQGDVKDMLVTREEEAKVRLAEQALEGRLRLAAKLNQLQQKFHLEGNREELLAELGRLQSTLFTGEGLQNTAEEVQETAEVPVSRQGV